MNLVYFKALHVIFVVSWFAGLFYIVRLFIYQTEANEKAEPERSILVEQLKLMSKKLWYIITWPAAILALLFGLAIMHPWLGQTWMTVKLILVGVLFFYHHLCHFKFKQLQKGIYKHTSQQLRYFNEIATILLVSIVFLVELKNTVNTVWAVLGFIVFGVLLMLAVTIYKRNRAKKKL